MEKSWCHYFCFLWLWSYQIICDQIWCLSKFICFWITSSASQSVSPWSNPYHVAQLALDTNFLICLVKFGPMFARQKYFSVLTGFLFILMIFVATKFLLCGYWQLAKLQSTNRNVLWNFRIREIHDLQSTNIGWHAYRLFKHCFKFCQKNIKLS